jgi:iron complex outermembrane receptor protein
MSSVFRVVLSGAAVVGLLAAPARAQQAPQNTTETPPPAAAAPAESNAATTTLPPLVVEQKQAPAKPKRKKVVTKAKPAAPKKVVAKSAPAPKPVATVSPPAAGIGEGSSSVAMGAPATANPGTPSAGTEPIFGQAGQPGGQTVTAIGEERFRNEPVFSVTDVLSESPGVSFKQGNGPRDIGISIRGSNARNGFAIRNIQVFEDGFPVTQPDGVSRTDLTDPHAYAGIDVWRGPSSAMFGNYATGGAINFRTRRGGDINGVEYGLDVGSFNYFNNYVIAGGKSGAFEASVFASDVRGDGYFGYSEFDTQTINALLSVQVTPRDKVTMKVINNELDTELPFRISLNQFRQNPFQKGCHTAATAAAGCATQNFLGTQQTAEEAGVYRDDRRTIWGTRWEHQVDADTSWRVQYVLDDRNIDQPTGRTSAVGDYLSHNVIADLSHHATTLGLDSTYYAGFFWNYLPIDSFSYLVAPGGGAPRGPLQSLTTGYTMNWGGRARAEVNLTEEISAVAGIGVEQTTLSGTSFSYDTSGGTGDTEIVTADRSFTNVAPEVGLLYRPNREWQVRGRIGTGYGTPQIGNLFVTPDGEPGNNTDLESQRNVGYDLGVDWTPTRALSFSVTGFYEFFKDELVTQAPTIAGNSNFTFNAPASEHRGIEIGADWRPFEGWRLTAAYTYNNQIYTDYEERVGDDDFDRAGNRIPGIAPNELTARIGYDQPTGPLKGAGGYVEYQWKDAFFMDNGNFLKAPGYDLVNLNVHYDTEFTTGYIRQLSAFFEIRNVFDETYIASANNVSNSSASLADSASIYAGTPRAYYGGVKVKF